MPDAILLQEERQTAKWRQHCVEPRSSMKRSNCSQLPAPSPKGSLLILHAAKRKHSPLASLSFSPGHRIIVILLVMLCGSCQAAWLASCQQFSCCLFAFTPGQREEEEEGSRARLCVLLVGCTRRMRIVLVVSSCCCCCCCIRARLNSSHSGPQAASLEAGTHAARLAELVSAATTTTTVATTKNRLKLRSATVAYAQNYLAFAAFHFN